MHITHISFKTLNNYSPKTLSKNTSTKATTMKLRSLFQSGILIILFSLATLMANAQATMYSYRLEIDICHSSINSEGTNNNVTILFKNGRKTKKTVISKLKATCEGENINIKMRTPSYITEVVIVNNEDDALCIDMLTLYRSSKGKSEEVIRTHGKNDGGGWCFSSDPNDGLGEWKDNCGNCRRSHSFDFKSGRNISYEVRIDVCHTEISHEGTKNKIMIDFMSGPMVEKTIYRDGVESNCYSSDASFKTSISEHIIISHINIVTNGDDGFYIDEIRLLRNGKVIKHYGGDNGGGWCLSTDPNDANGSWKGKCSGTGNSCVPSVKYSYY